MRAERHVDQLDTVPIEEDGSCTWRILIEAVCLLVGRAVVQHRHKQRRRRHTKHQLHVPLRLEPVAGVAVARLKEVYKRQECCGKLKPCAERVGHVAEEYHANCLWRVHMRWPQPDSPAAAKNAAGEGGAHHAGGHEAAEDHAVREVLAIGAQCRRPLQSEVSPQHQVAWALWQTNRDKSGVRC